MKLKKFAIMAFNGKRAVLMPVEAKTERAAMAKVVKAGMKLISCYELIEKVLK